MSFSKIRNFIIIITLLILAGGAGYRLGERQVGFSLGNKSLVNVNPTVGNNIDFGLFWDVWSRVHTSFIDAKTIDNQKLVWGAISGMVGALGDPYTSFLPPKENQNFKDDMNGSFEGIGAQLGLKDGRIIVVTPLKSSPAEAAGVKPGDYVLKVDNVDTVNWTIEEAVSKIRGQKGTKVVLSILHDKAQEPQDLSITRDQIIIPEVEYWAKEPSKIEPILGLTNTPIIKQGNSTIGYIRLTRFGDRLTEEWNKAVDALLKENQTNKISGLILDLRNNPGGYLDGSVFVGSEFLPDGIVVSQENSDNTKIDYRVNRKGRLFDIPLVVLINKGSASASEIVAGALKDRKRATIVGETSFGKGSVQTPQELSGGASLHVTTGRWLTPSGTSISKKGIIPDVEVKLDTASEASQDAQLAKAIEIILK
jgi:carboxyl-terminal processing protease